VNVANYEMLDHFDPEAFGGVVLDESSILKNFMGIVKQTLMGMFERTPFKLCCTATPAPNDHLELGNHAHFLGVMPANEMLMRWFINDTMQAGGYRLKKHAEADYWQWVCSWAVCMDKPSDLGFADDGYVLPPLVIEPHIVEVDNTDGAEDALFRSVTLSATTIHKEMRRTACERAARLAAIVNSDEERGAWLLWCNTNYEADAIRAILPEAVEVRGNDSVAVKERRLADFAEGRTRILLSKPGICGFGLNFQHCRNMAFVGLSYSYEQFYQALRRCWRYGQSKPVHAHVIYADTEGDVLLSIQRKQKDHLEMKSAMTDAARAVQLEVQGRRLIETVETDVATGNGWTLYLGDSCQTIRNLESDSVGFSIFSPPFSNLYIYSDSLADMGNAADDEEFFAHFRYLIGEMLRVTIPGRLASVHCKDLPLYKGRDGAAGLKDFPGDIIRAFEAEGWTFHSRVTIWKDPVIEMQRTKNHGLLYKNLCQDSSVSRQGMADYLLTFRKWDGLEDGNAFSVQPVTAGAERFQVGEYVGENPPTDFDNERRYSIQVWQRYASPVWFDVQQTRVLNYQLARDNSDEKHICPLQLDVIERAVKLWSNPGDLVLSPFAGIGSEGYEAIRHGRCFVGIELKRSYWCHAVNNLKRAEVESGQGDLFSAQLEEAAEVA
jgi:hypothetical protein